MNLDADRISIAHVHAYVDAQLSDGECQRLEDYLDINPDKFEQLQQFLSINDHYQSMYNPVLKEAIPQSILDRVFGENHDPFQTHDSGENELSQTLSRLPFEKSGTWISDLKLSFYSLLQLNHPKDTAWLVRLRATMSVLGEWLESAIGSVFKACRLHPQTAPDWFNPLAHRTATLLGNIRNSFREVNLFAITSMIATGIVIGVFMGSSADSAIVPPENLGKMESQAIQAHLFYRKEGQLLLESDEEKQHQLLTWVSGRLGREIRLINFAEMGYRNAGMTLVPTKDNFAMVTVYEDDQSRKLTLTVGLRDAGKTDDIVCAVRENTKSLCSWANDKLQFVVVSDLEVIETKQLAEWMKQNYSMAHLISSNEYFFSQTLGTINA